MSYHPQNRHERFTIPLYPESRYVFHTNYSSDQLSPIPPPEDGTSKVVGHLCDTTAAILGKRMFPPPIEPHPQRKKRKGGLTGLGIAKKDLVFEQGFLWVAQNAPRQIHQNTERRYDNPQLQTHPKNSRSNNFGNEIGAWVSERLGERIMQKDAYHPDGKMVTNTNVLPESETWSSNSSHTLESNNELYDCPTPNTIYSNTIYSNTIYSTREESGDDFEYKSDENEQQFSERACERQSDQKSSFGIQKIYIPSIDEYNPTSLRQKNLPLIDQVEKTSEPQLPDGCDQESKDGSPAQPLFQEDKWQPIARRIALKAHGNSQQPSTQQASSGERFDQQFAKKTSKFHRFMELPPEIRLIVWKEFLRYQQPRTVVMYCEMTGQDSSGVERIEEVKDPPATTLEEFYNASQAKPPLGWFWKLKTAKCPIPAILHATKESRAFAETCFKLTFSHQLGGKPVWFDYKKDWLLMDSGAAFDLFMHGVRNGPKDKRKRIKVKSKMQRLALGNLSPTDVVELCERIPKFKSLQALYLEKSFAERKEWEDYFFSRVGLEIRARTSQPTVAAMNPPDFNKALSMLEVKSESRPNLMCPPRKDQLFPPSSQDIQKFRQLARTGFLDAIRTANYQRTLTLNLKSNRERFS